MSQIVIKKSARVKHAMRIVFLAAAIPLLSGVTKVERFHTGVYDLKTHNISLHWKKVDGLPYGSLLSLKEALEASGEKVIALTNAGIYAKNFSPLGLHIENGQRLRSINRAKGGGNFFLKPNGVFLIDKKGARIVRTGKLKSTKGVQIATQSGPLLFDEKGIHPRFLKNSRSRYIRNAVGVRSDGSVVLVISRIPVTFWELATFMKDKMKCKTGLYLDGSISAMWTKGKKATHQFIPFVGILAVTKAR